MISQAAPQTLVMEDDGESLMEIRRYATPSTGLVGVAPTLRTWVTAFAKRNAFEDAAEHGPRYNEGMTSDTAEEEEDPAFEDLSRLPIVQLAVTRRDCRGEALGVL